MEPSAPGDIRIEGHAFGHHRALIRVERHAATNTEGGLDHATAGAWS